MRQEEMIGVRGSVKFVHKARKESLRLAEDRIYGVIQELFPWCEVRLRETSHDSLACGS